MPVKRKTSAKRKKPAGLAKYQAKLKKATSAIDKRIKKSESMLKKMKAEKAKKVKAVRAAIKRAKK